jgi:hypothetical protein
LTGRHPSVRFASIHPRTSRLHNRKRAALVGVVAAFSVLAVLNVQFAGATHPRPKSATPLYVSIVPAYKQCTASNRTHGPPLAFPSCNPPVPTSSYLTVGTPDAGGGPANSVASLKMKVISSPPDFLMTLNAADIRCRPAGPPGACSAANASGGPDYSGEIYFQVALRITDHWSSRVQPPPPDDPYDQPGTGEAGFLPPPIASCASTASTSIGSTCSVSTTGNAIAPGFSPAVGTKRFLMEVGQVQVFDGGPDGVAFFGSPPGSDTLFGVQGIFVP